MLVLHFYGSYFNSQECDVIAFKDLPTFRDKFTTVFEEKSRKIIGYLVGIFLDNEAYMNTIMETLLANKGTHILLGASYDGSATYFHDRVDDNEFFKPILDWTHKLMLTDIEYVS